MFRNGLWRQIKKDIKIQLFVVFLIQLVVVLIYTYYLSKIFVNSYASKNSLNHEHLTSLVKNDLKNVHKRSNIESSNLESNYFHLQSTVESQTTSIKHVQTVTSSTLSTILTTSTSTTTTTTKKSTTTTSSTTTSSTTTSLEIITRLKSAMIFDNATTSKINLNLPSTKSVLISTSLRPLITRNQLDEARLTNSSVRPLPTQTAPPLPPYNNKESMKYLREAKYKDNIKFSACRPKEAFNLHEDFMSIKYTQLTDRKVQLLADTSNISSVALNTPIYEIQLDNEYLETYFDVSKPVTCIMQQFGKSLNVVENFKWYGPGMELNATNSFMIRIRQHGFYSLTCYVLEKKPDLYEVLYEDLLIILPKNMSELVAEQAAFKQLIEEKKKTLSDWKFNPMLNDVEFERCNQQDPPTPTAVRKKKMNVLVIGLDSVAMNHFRRIFPVTYKYLTEQFEQNVFYERYNKIGENTYPNIVPTLTGLVIDSHTEYNLNYELGFFRQIDSTYHDNLPFIWREYEKLGYLSMFNEEKVKIGMFRLKRNGFRYPPVSLFTQPFYLKLETIHQPILCYENEPVYVKSLNQIRQFVDRMNSPDNIDLPYFSFNFLKYYTHDYLSVPQDLDYKLRNLIKYFESKRYLDNTLFILMSDHGSRLTKYSYQSKIGKLERSLPFFSMRLPKPLWNTEYHRNAVLNKDKLLTAHDIYKTLKHFRYMNKNLERLEEPGAPINSNDCRRNFAQNVKHVRNRRGISLLERHPENRTCADALIPVIFCTSMPRIVLSDAAFMNETGYSVYYASKFIEQYVVKMTDEVRDKCKVYKLKKTESVRKVVSQFQTIYILQVLLEPGHSLFEAYLILKEKKFETYNLVTRLSRYKQQSNCMTKSSLMGFCFCI